jgi:hypothetical protein
MTNNPNNLNDFEPASMRGGFFPGILLPPFAVIMVGLILALFTGGILVDHNVMASSVLVDSIGKGGDYTQVDFNPNQSSISGKPGDGVMELSALFTPEVLYWKEWILLWSSQFEVDPNLIATVMQIESCGNPDAQSYAGATGLFQVMPFHFEISENPYDVETNALRGLNYLKRSFSTAAGDISLALAGYNGGISVIGNPSSSWADETIRYVYWGSGIYQEAVQGNGSSQRLVEWLTNGGASLCRQASIKLGLDN